MVAKQKAVKKEKKVVSETEEQIIDSELEGKEIAKTATHKGVSPDGQKEAGVHVVLVITEKPQAAQKIADALSEGRDHKYNEGGVPYYEFNKNGKRIIVGCAVGHLFGLQQEKGKAEIPAFNVTWKPAYEGKKKTSNFTKKYYLALKKLASHADEFIVATDYDVEGEVIGWNVVRFIAKQKDAKRMKFSSLTKDELNNAYENLQPELNWSQAIAGETRHYIDWFYGINLSRALMRSLSKAGRFRIMSVGRVQGPALKIIADKEIQIKNFVSEPYWQVFMQISDLNNQRVEVKYPKDLMNKSELLKFQQLKGKKATAKTEFKDDKVLPPNPFDLTTLQTEAYKFHSLTPSQTLAIAQKLYLEGLISYPRTSSQQYPEAIGYDKIMKNLTKNFKFTSYAINKKPVEGKKTDPAHPAIYPTGEFRKLEGNEKNIYELVVRRFVSCFCDAAVIEEKKISVEVNGLEFFAKGLTVKEKGWMNVYKESVKEEEVPTINGEVLVREIRIEEKQTQPPKRYSASSLLKELEKRNLGTKATRASIIETLYDRGYVKEKSIEATPLGLKLIETLEKHSPIIIDEELTRSIEDEMENMNGNKKHLEEVQGKILGKTKEVITKITADMRKDEEEIGKELGEGTEEMWAQEKEDAKLTECKKCGKGNLRIMYNKASRRFFVGCSNYPECKNTFSLPPNSLIKAVKDDEGKPELCKECQGPILLSIRAGKRPWKFCFNPECVTNKAWAAKRAQASEVVSSDEQKKRAASAAAVATGNSEVKTAPNGVSSDEQKQKEEIVAHAGVSPDGQKKAVAKTVKKKKI